VYNFELSNKEALLSDCQEENMNLVYQTEAEYTFCSFPISQQERLLELQTFLYAVLTKSNCKLELLTSKVFAFKNKLELCLLQNCIIFLSSDYESHLSTALLDCISQKFGVKEWKVTRL